jgi:hypothetical protein
MNTVNIEKYTPSWIRELYGIKAPANATANATANASATATANVKSSNLFKEPPKLPTNVFGSLKTTAMAYAPALPGALALPGAGSFKQIFAYLLAIIIIIGIILVVIHTFITPIFQFQPGAPGIIPVGMDDGKLFWDKGNKTETIKEKGIIIEGTHQNYSLNIDIFIENPADFANIPRLLFSRGGVPTTPTPTTSDTILSILSDYNFAVALKPDTTDVIVSVLDSATQSQEVIINNAPVQKPFRLGIIIMEKALEVYMNNQLISSKPLQNPPKAATGDIIVPTTSYAKMRNLKIWNRVLSSPEIRNASPAITSASDFLAEPIKSTTTC